MIMIIFTVNYDFPFRFYISMPNLDTKSKIWNKIPMVIYVLLIALHLIPNVDSRFNKSIIKLLLAILILIPNHDSQLKIWCQR